MKRLHLGNTLGTELPLNLLEGQHPSTSWDVQGFAALVEDLTSDGRTMIVYAICVHSTQPIQLAETVGILRSCGDANVARFVVSSPGYRPLSVSPSDVYLGGDETIENVQLVVTDSTTGILRGVSVANHQPVTSAVISNVDVSGAPGAVAINLPTSGINSGVSSTL